MAEASRGPSQENVGKEEKESINKWEYRRLQFSWGSEVGKGLGLVSSFVFRKNGQDMKLPPGGRYDEAISEDISKLGNEGWECVGFSSSWPSSGAVEVYLFKKRVSPQNA